MRKIEKQMLAACKGKISWHKDNTAVFAGMTYSSIHLHGNHIADYYHETGEVVPNISTYYAWPTRTTKSRLNALGVNYKAL